MFVAGIAAVGVTHQLGWLFTSKDRLVVSEGDAVRRAVSMNNLKQIWLALNQYEGVHRFLPPGATFDRNGYPLHGWQTLILPFMEQSVLFDQIDLALPWNDPAQCTDLSK